MQCEPIIVIVPPESYSDPQTLIDEWNRFQKRNLVIYKFIDEYVRVKCVSPEESMIRGKTYYASVREWYINVQNEYNRQVELHKERHEDVRCRALRKLHAGAVLSDEEVDACIVRTTSNTSLATLEN